MTLAPQAPERTVDMEEIIPFYHFLLVDNCLIHSDSGLSEQLYTVRDPSHLLRFTTRIEDLIRDTESMREYISKYDHLYVTPEIQREMGPLTIHLREVASYQGRKIVQQQQELRQRNGRPKFSRWNKRHNKRLEQQEEEDFNPSGHQSIVEHTIRLMHDAANAMESLSQEFPVYQHSGNLPRLATMKASVADASLVGALMDYAQKPENKKHTAAILTADGDVIQLFHRHLQTLSPTEQIDLSSRVAVHFRSHTEKVFIRIGYYLPREVKERGEYI